MSNTEFDLEYAIGSMERTKAALEELTAELPVDKPLDAWSVHQLRVALEFISEELLKDGIQCKSTLQQIERKREDDAGAPSDVTLPSPPTDLVEDNMEDDNHSCHCEDVYPDTPSSASTGHGMARMSDFGYDTDQGWSYHPSDDSSD